MKITERLASLTAKTMNITGNIAANTLAASSSVITKDNAYKVAKAAGYATGYVGEKAKQAATKVSDEIKVFKYEYAVEKQRQLNAKNRQMVEELTTTIGKITDNTQK